MSLIIGLDVSTSATGICVVNTTIPVDDAGSHILLLDCIQFKGCDTLWSKADATQAYLKSIFTSISLTAVKTLPLGYTNDIRVVLEEPLMGFRPGMSSAQTISTLMRFNGIVSYIARNVFGSEPEYIGSGHARKLCGIKLVRTAIGGAQKEQVFSHMQNNDLKQIVWPLKKNGKEVDWSRDACDAYVIARAASIAGKIVVEKKKKKTTRAAKTI